MEPKPLMNMIWAVDVFETDEFQVHAQFTLGSLSRSLGSRIWPIHILGYPYVDAGEVTEAEQAYTALARQRLRELGTKLEVLRMEPGVVRINRRGSYRHATELVVDYAREMKADAIVVSTHSRGSLGRWLIGSFAETLLLTSSIPVLSVNPVARVRERISRVLVPTTFEPTATPDLEKVSELGALLNAKLTFIYQQPDFPCLGYPAELAPYLAERSLERKEVARVWASRLSHSTLEVEFEMNEDPRPVADSVLKYASDHNVDLIVMTANRDFDDGPRVGSLTRKIVRTAQCPVLTLPPGCW